MTGVSRGDRIAGAIFGTAVGDALGYPVEFLRGVTVRDFLPPYYYSDDTQMTIATVEGALKTDHAPNKCLPGLEENIATELAKWNESQDMPANRRAPGNTCLTSTARLHKGVSWKESGVYSAGCGTTMRMGILGLLLTEKEIIERAPGIAAMTHTDPRAIAGGVGAALTVKHISDGAMVSEIVGHLTRTFTGEEYHALKCPEMVTLLDRVKELSEKNIHKRLEPEWYLSPPVWITERLGEGWVADECLALALTLTVWAGADFKKGVLASANLERADKDSVGAVVGCFLGTLAGGGRIPHTWRNNIETSDTLVSISARIEAWAGPRLSYDRIDDNK